MKEVSDIVIQRRAMAIYRLLWYFGQTFSLYDKVRDSCAFRVKYKGYVFRIGDDIESDGLRIDSSHLIPRGEPHSTETGQSRARLKRPRLYYHCDGG